jgi:hypothetical protein
MLESSMQPAQTSVRPSRGNVSAVTGHLWDELFAFRAPYLEKKLLMNKIVASQEEAWELFTEVKRYLVMIESDHDHVYPLFALRVDEVWHQFVLFSKEYAAFCERFFGRFLHHYPSNAPGGDSIKRTPEATQGEMEEAYRALFGIDMPDVWRDELSMKPSRRLLRNDLAGAFSVRVDAGKAELVLTADQGDRVLVRVDSWGEAALRFIASHDAFFVRELPGDVHDDDRDALCRALVASYVLRVAP